MADDTIRVTTESTEKDDQNDGGDSESQSRHLKADQDILKKKLSKSKLESGASIGSSSAVEDTLGEDIGFDQKMSKAKLSGEQIEVGGSSTKQEDQKDGTDDEIRAYISDLSRCIRDVDRTIMRIEATPTTEEEAEKVNAVIEMLKADHNILKTDLSELKIRFGESAGLSAEQEDQNDAIEDEIFVNIFNLSFCFKAIGRAMALMQATPRATEEMEELNAAFQRLKAGEDAAKKTLSMWNLEFRKSDSLFDVGKSSNYPKESKEMQNTKSEMEGDIDSDSGESTNEEMRRAIAESTEEITFTEGGPVSKRLMDSIEHGEELEHTSSNVEDMETIVLRGLMQNLLEDLDPANSRRQWNETQPAIEPETVSPRVAVVTRPELLQRSDILREQIIAVIAGLCALYGFFGARAKEGEGQGPNKD